MEAVEKIYEEMRRGSRVLIVRGAAGTGKTTLVKALCPRLEALGKHVALMAPTGRAALVLGKRTDRPASTIHSGIFNIHDRPVEDRSGNALKWIFPLKREPEVENTVFIVDEASMVGLDRHDNDRELLQFGSGSLLGDLVEYSGIRTPGTTNALIFVGDPFQLPPVGERCERPPALDEGKLEELTGFRPDVVELDEVHRQSAGSGILAEATKIRKALDSKDFNFFSLSPHPDVAVVPEGDIVEHFRPGTNIDDRIVVAFTNRKVREYNCYIRAALGRTCVLPTPGERLISLKNTRITLPSGEAVGFYNGDFLNVLDTQGETRELTGFYRPKDSEKSYEFKYVFQKMTVVWTYEPERGCARDLWVNVTPVVSPDWDGMEDHASIGLYNGVKKMVEDELRAQYPDFRRDRARKAFWDELVRSKLQESPFLRAPVIRFGYAVTGHKSQGGEWDTVFADYSAASSAASSQYFRWAYTVTTRAKRRLFAACVPEVDSVAEVFGAQQAVATAASDGESSLKGILRECGFVAGETIDYPYRRRVSVSPSAEGAGGSGYIDVVYNGKDVVKSVGVSVDGADDLLKRRLEQFVGGTLTAMFEGPGKDGPSVSDKAEIEVRDEYRPVVDRMVERLDIAGIKPFSVKALPRNPYQVRFGFRDGMFEVYFNGKGRLTSCGSHTLPQDAWMTVLAVLKKSCD